MGVELNQVTIAGNMVRDPELRETKGGTSVTSFTVAVNRTYYTDKKEKKEECSFIKVTAWSKLAETVCKYLTKGSPLIVIGQIKQESWEDDEGNKRDKTGVTATNVQFLSQKPKSDNNDQEQYSQEVEEGRPTAGIEDEDTDVPF